MQYILCLLQLLVSPQRQWQRQPVNTNCIILAKIKKKKVSLCVFFSCKTSENIFCFVPLENKGKSYAAQRDVVTFALKNNIIKIQ